MNQALGMHGKGEIEELCQKTLDHFAEALADDLNISAALGALFDFVREMNCACDSGHISKEEAKKALDLMRKFDAVLGVFSFEQQETSIPADLQEAFERRLQARQDKNWKLADELRDYIQQRGYVMEDTPNGVRLKKA